MRSKLVLLLAAMLVPATGCKWFDELKTNPQGRKPTEKVPEVSADKLVNFLNDRAERLRSIEYSDTSMRVSGKGIPMAATLRGSLAAAKPRNFRMSSTAKIAGKVDMGSNDQEFWVFLDAPGDSPMYVYASHADFESGKARMPGGIPFEPDWVLQALGMTTFPSTNQYSVRINERERTYTLSWLSASPNGGTVLKEIVFDVDPATGTRPQVKQHILRNGKTNALIATAEIKSAQTERIGIVKGTELPAAVQYPTQIVLKWVEPRFEMDLNLDKATVNALPAGDRGLFARPEIRGTPAIDLARYEYK